MPEQPLPEIGITFQVDDTRFCRGSLQKEIYGVVIAGQIFVQNTVAFLESHFVFIIHAYFRSSGFR